jgi:hypothetical protein
MQVYCFDSMRCRLEAGGGYSKARERKKRRLPAEVIRAAGQQGNPVLPRYETGVLARWSFPGSAAPNIPSGSGSILTKAVVQGLCFCVP